MIILSKSYLHKDIYYKLIIITIFFLLSFISYTKNLLSKNKIEIKVIRYIKHKKFNKPNIYLKGKYLEYQKYVKLLKEGYFKNEIYHYNIFKPQISFVASVYNKEKYLTSFITSIQNQNLKEFELIFVDDNSTDNSIKIINNFMKKDKRIKLIKNKKNMGTLFTRYNGAIYAKGEYIIFVDSDDIVLKEGISNSYNYIKQKNLDMIEFNTIFEENNNTVYISRRYYKYSKIIYQPILSYIFYYTKNKGLELNTALWDKLTKREIVIKSFNFMGKEYLNKKIIIENDVIILFSLFQISNSFQYIDEIGYYYCYENKDSITNTRYEPEKANQIIYSMFSNIEFLYEKTKYTNFDKYFCIYKLIQGYNRYKICFNYLNRGFEFIKNIFNNLLESNYISHENKLIIRNISNEIFMNNTFKKNNIF